MRYIDAAVAVLADADTPLSAIEITDRAVARGLVKPKGQTPEATMSAELYLEARRPNTRLAKVAIPGRIRAVRGSVRWVLGNPPLRREQ